MENKSVSNDRNLFLQIPENEFARIILDFLGAKETISKKVNASFCIDIDDLKQFHYLLMQKVDREKFINLNIFSAKIRYNDSSERILNTFDSFEKYHEQRNVLADSVSLYWNMIVNFSNSKHVETQKVSLTISKENSNNDGEIVYSIEHTNQSWGFEVCNLFDSQIKKIAIYKTRLIDFVAYLNKNIYNYLSILFIVLLLINIFNVYKRDIVLREGTDDYIRSENLKRDISSIRMQYQGDINYFILNRLYEFYDNKELDEIELDKFVNYLLFTHEGFIENKNYSNFIRKDEGWLLDTYIYKKIDTLDELLNDKNIMYNIINIKNNIGIKNEKIKNLIEIIESWHLEIKDKKQKLDKIIGKHSLKNNLWLITKKESFFFAKYLSVMVFIFLLFQYILFYLRGKSFILITKEEHIARNKYLLKRSKSILTLSIAFVVSIFTGIIANVLYNFMSHI